MVRVTAAECASHPVADREVVPNIGRPAAQAAGLLVVSGGVSVVRQRLFSAVWSRGQPREGLHWYAAVPAVAEF
jgi:hypothetical protein